MSQDLFMVVGLGNPGRKYKDNRHNVGFMLVDRLAVRLNARMSRMQAKSLVASTTYKGRKIILAKPQTYMNLSGQSIQGLTRFYKLPLEKVIVAHDDLDLPLGTIRIRPGGGAGGQKGIASAIERLGTRDFPRLRIGIGRPPGRMDPSSYVLQDFSQADLIILSEVLDYAADAALSLILDGMDVAMNRYNGDLREM